MGLFKGRTVNRNSATRLPIVFCVDVSGSMGVKGKGGKTPISIVRRCIDNFVTELKKDSNTAAAAELALITFSKETKCIIDFKPVGSFHPNIAVDTKASRNETRISQAMVYSIDKIKKKTQALRQQQIAYYPPILILITDGVPEEDNDEQEWQEKALNELHKCKQTGNREKRSIIPIIIGIGKKESAVLTAYGQTYLKGYFPIDDEKARLEINMKGILSCISKSVVQSTNGRQDDNNLRKELEKEREHMSDEYRMSEG